MKILVLGHNGMLGHMVCKYLEFNNLNVIRTDLRWPSKELKEFLKNCNGDFIINCIGAIPQKRSTFSVNWKLPVFLTKISHVRVVHPSTDCEIDSDGYGMSKRIASEFIKKRSSNTKILKASVIGPEICNKCGLMEWFLNSSVSVNGYTNAFWNGVTTLEWSKQCLNLINEWDKYGKETVIEGERLSKFDLLNRIKVAFDKKINIVECETGFVDKSLYSDIKAPSIKEQLTYLKDFYYENN